MAKIHVRTHFRNKDLVFRGKRSKGFDMEDEEERAEYHHWMQRYGFMRDITALLEVNDL